MYLCDLDMFELGRRSAARSEQAKLEKIAKSSYQWEAVKRPVPRGEWKDSVCFEKGAMMDSFAAVMATSGYSSMYEASISLWTMLMNNFITVSMLVCDWPSFFCRLKIN